MRKKYILSLLISLVIITTVSIVITLMASGYRFDPETKNLQGTGIISITSKPDGALVFINEVPRDATDTSISNLRPGNYTVRLEKEGYVAWQEEVLVNKQLVSKIEALLIPLYPSFRPLTVTGVDKAYLSPDGLKLIYTVMDDPSAGLWLLNLEERPFSLSQKPQLILRDSDTKAYSQASYTWSPNGNDVLIELPNQFELLETSSRSTTPLTNTNDLTTEWKSLELLIEESRITALNSEKQDFIKSQANKIWSPNGNYLLYKSEGENEIHYHLYPAIPNSSQFGIIPTPEVEEKEIIFSIAKDIEHSISWFPDSRHLVLTKKTSAESTVVEIMTITGEHRTQLFSGTIKELQVFPDPNGSQIIILTRFNPESPIHNLYSVILR